MRTHLGIWGKREQRWCVLPWEDGDSWAASDAEVTCKDCRRIALQYFASRVADLQGKKV